MCSPTFEWCASGTRGAGSDWLATQRIFDLGLHRFGSLHTQARQRYALKPLALKADCASKRLRGAEIVWHFPKNGLPATHKLRP